MVEGFPARNPRSLIKKVLPQAQPSRKIRRNPPKQAILLFDANLRPNRCGFSVEQANLMELHLVKRMKSFIGSGRRGQVKSFGPGRSDLLYL